MLFALSRVIKYPGQTMRRFFIIVQIFFFWTASCFAATPSRLKDITVTKGIRDNLLIGYGLVVGLNGTGDTATNTEYTRISLASMFERLGVKVDTAAIKSNSVAAVIVTANLPPFSRNGSRIDVEISSVGDAKSLLGGTLLATPLQGADGEVYAVAQGPLAVGGFKAQGETETVTKGVPTSAKITNGAIIEKELSFDINALSETLLHLKNPDFTTSKRIAHAINEKFLLSIAFPLDPATVRVKVPRQYQGKMVEFMTKVEEITVMPDQAARIVMNEDSGIIVMGENVKISRVAIAQANLVIEVQNNQNVTMPGPFTNVGQAERTTETMINIDENSDARMRVLEPAANLSALVAGLNAFGVGPRDLMTILQSVKAAGALQADLQII